MSRHRCCVRAPLAVALAACVGLSACSGGEEQEVVWLETAHYEWSFFNHRLSFLDVGVAEGDAWFTVIGGTSTTNVVTTLPAGCEAQEDSCREFPFADTAQVVLGRGRVATKHAAFGTGTAELVATDAGASTTLAIEVDGTGEPTVVLRGFSFDTAHPLQGDSACYDPANGWHPTAIEVELGAPTLADGVVEVEVSARFGAGATLDPDRQCIDDVHDRAQVPVTVDVLAVVADDPAVTEQVQLGASYAFSGDAANPGEQTAPDPVSIGLPADALAGWTALRFAFNPADPDGRGAYLRTLGIALDGTSASGTATNYSPLTQLWAMEYAFEGELAAVDVGVAPTHERFEGEVAVRLEADGSPMRQTVSPE